MRRLWRWLTADTYVWGNTDTPRWVKIIFLPALATVPFILVGMMALLWTVGREKAELGINYREARCLTYQGEISSCWLITEPHKAVKRK